MGVSNKQRRAAKAKKRARARGAARTAGAAWVRDEPVLTSSAVRSLLLDVVEQIWNDSTAAARCAALLLAPGRPLTPEIARAGLRALLDDLVRGVVSNGWAPRDLAEITRRRAGEEHISAVVALLHDEAGRHAGRVPAAWAADLARIGPGSAVDLQTARGMQAALEVAAVLVRLPAIVPVLPALGAQTTGSSDVAPGDAKLLARVQALLAKAEATEFPEEAEALSAKAQELVSRHALERILTRADAGRPDARPVARRLWLDAPYVFPKAMLVHVVAGANRCRSVVSEPLGFCTLVGLPDDLDAVELLVPSLLVQAHRAMRRYGRQTDRTGTSRTRSFRQSFLLSYGQRIGERLEGADRGVAASSARRGELVPVLRRQEERLQATCDQLFPHLTSKAGTVGNASGWAAGRAAADQALLGADQQVTAAAS
jgi:hypothetical protein